jgi:hypothetical protein
VAATAAPALWCASIDSDLEFECYLRFGVRKHPKSVAARVRASTHAAYHPRTYNDAARNATSTANAAAAAAAAGANEGSSGDTGDILTTSAVAVTKNPSGDASGASGSVVVGQEQILQAQQQPRKQSSQRQAREEQQHSQQQSQLQEQKSVSQEEQHEQKSARNPPQFQSLQSLKEQVQARKRAEAAREQDAFAALVDQAASAHADEDLALQAMVAAQVDRDYAELQKRKRRRRWLHEKPPPLLQAWMRPSQSAALKSKNGTQEASKVAVLGADSHSKNSKSQKKKNKNSNDAVNKMSASTMNDAGNKSGNDIENADSNSSTAGGIESLAEAATSFRRRRLRARPLPSDTAHLLTRLQHKMVPEPLQNNGKIVKFPSSPSVQRQHHPSLPNSTNSSAVSESGGVVKEGIKHNMKDVESAEGGKEDKEKEEGDEDELIGVGARVVVPITWDQTLLLCQKRFGHTNQCDACLDGDASNLRALALEV